jgi:iron complex outermembrane recepter protein
MVLPLPAGNLMHLICLKKHPRRAVALVRSLTSLTSALFVSGFSTAVWGQNAATTLEKVIVTGNPLGSTEVASPVSVLTGDALVLKRASTLGETLNGLPGVSSTSFGPNASRPVIRGLDGDRVRILSNAGASLDASSLSFDHAVPIDPLIVERLEVLRGPGALLYGGSATGGVVNALDNRIPKDALKGTSGAAELRWGGADFERGGAFLVEAGNGQFAGHVDVFGRSTSDLAVPRYVPIEAGVSLPSTTRVRNSAASTRGGAAGASLFFGKSRIGMSLDTYDSSYGTVVEPDVVIKMKRDHLGVDSEFKDLGGPFTALRLQFNQTRYQHQEVDGAGTVGTTFKTSGTELRVEAPHAPIGSLRGVVGAQLEYVQFSALGDEAFVPSTRTQKQAIFALEEVNWAGGVLSAGLRLERARVDSEGDADPTAPKFGEPVQRRFPTRSASVANVLKLNPHWSLTGTWSTSQRAPTSFELYANGVHAATGSFERGDVTLGVERGSNLDVALQWKSGPDHLRMGAYASRFSNFISLEANGQTVQQADGQGGFNAYPEYVFKPVRVRLSGLEFEGQKRVLSGAVNVDVSGKLDVSRALNTDTNQPLPRIAPLRFNVGLDVASSTWSGRVEVDRAAAQNRVPATDVATPGYTLLNLSLTRRFAFSAFGRTDSTGSTGSTDAVWFFKLNNAANTLAYSAGAIPTVRELAPLAGRSFKTGIRLAF